MNLMWVHLLRNDTLNTLALTNWLILNNAWCWDLDFIFIYRKNHYKFFRLEFNWQKNVKNYKAFKIYLYIFCNFVNFIIFYIFLLVKLSTQKRTKYIYIYFVCFIIFDISDLWHSPKLKIIKDSLCIRWMSQWSPVYQ